MLWLIWIGLMVAVPSLAGVQVWRELHRDTQSKAPVSSQTAKDTLKA